MQIQDWILLLALAALVALAGRYWWKHRDTCCGNCSGCSKCCQCKKANTKNK